MLNLPSTWTALWFLAPVIVIGIWVAWSDMKFMKIPNKAVIALFLAYVVIGPIALPWQDWLWGIALGLGVLVIGFLASAIGLVGAGDAKFAAAMAPFFYGGDYRIIAALYSACLLGAFATHRLARLIPPIRRATQDWASWTHKDFPMGLALSGTIIFYFVGSLLISA